MGARLNQILSDRWCNIIVRLIAYVFLIVAILGFHSSAGQMLIAAIGALSLILIVHLRLLCMHPVVGYYDSKKNVGKAKEKVSVGMKIKRGDINTYAGLIGYVILLGVILAPPNEYLWLFYGFIGLGVLGAVVKLFR